MTEDQRVADNPRVTLITRAACHLCGPARDAVARACAATGQRWRELRIDGDAALQAEYGDRIPVALLDDEEFACLAVDADELAAALRP